MHRTTIAGGLILSLCTIAAAETVTIGPSQDNTIYAESALLSNGTGPGVFCGRTGFGSIRRGLIRFDVAAAVPSGATIQSATLQMVNTRSISSGHTIRLYRVTSAWGEGASYSSPGGVGAPAEPGDATWSYRFFDSADWASSGGDYLGESSADATVGDPNNPTQWVSDELAADVQDWLNNPAANFGWIIRGNETTNGSAIRFGSREESSPARRPRLTIEFGDSAPCPADLNGDNVVNLTDLAVLLANFGLSGTTHAQGDIDGDGDTDLSDLALLLSAFGTNCP